MPRVTIDHAIASTIDALIGGALVVLPGSGLRSVLRLPTRPGFDEVALAVGTSLMVSTAIGALLLGLGLFHPLLMALPLVALGALGFPRLAIWARKRRPGPEIIALGVLTIPWYWSALQPGASPSNLFQWYYWDLGRVLGQVGAVPSFVTEYGTRIRWLPDYLAFNILSESYRGLTGFLGATDAIVAFRVPIAALGIAAVYAVMTLWFPRWVSVFGTALSTSTVWFVTKFNGYKPESLGVVIGLLGLYLAVRGLRDRDVRVLAFVGVLLGLDLAVHAIAATVVGLLLAGALIAELIRSKPETRRASIAAIALALFLALATSGGLGWALQGRAWPLGDASHPARRADGSDPTLVFIRRDSGVFGPVSEPSIATEFSRSLGTPWPGVDLDHPWAIIAGAIVLIGLVRAATRRGRVRTAAVAVAAMAGLIAIAVFWFAFRYDTYVPRHTGLGRFTQYEPLLLVLTATLAVAALVPSPRAREQSRRERQRRALVRRIGAGACAIAALGFGFANVRRVNSYQVTIPDPAVRMLDYLGNQSTPGEVVLANVSGRGLLEFWTDIEAPIESRQALLENSEFGVAATKLLEDSNLFFTGTGAPDLASRIGANWILIADSPRALGATVGLGTPPPGWNPEGFSLVHTERHLALFHRSTPLAPIQTVGHGRTYPQRVLILLAVPGIVGGAFWVRRRTMRRRDRPSPGPDSPRTNRSQPRRAAVRPMTPRNPNG